MTVRTSHEEDYDDFLVKWWKDWRWPAPPPKDMIPFQTGIIVSESGVNVCAGFLFLTNTKAAWLEYIVSNIEVKDRSLRKAAIETTIKTLCEMAKNAGIRYIYTSLKNQSLVGAYEECQFVRGSSNCLEMIKVIQ